MSFSTKLILIIFGLAYLISPVDLIPDLLLPWVGWIDDGVILWSIYYLIRYGELPWFLFKKKGPFTKQGPGPGEQKKADAKKRNKETKKADKTGPDRTKAQRSPHEILGVKATASWPEVQSAYREKIKQYHPDKVSHLGKEFADLANERFLEIQAAYNTLKKERSFK